jgi:hypothetical protein
MRVAILGSKGWNDYQFIVNALDNFRKDVDVSEFVIVYDKGAAKLGMRYAIEKEIPFTEKVVDWTDMSPPCKIKRNKWGKYNSLAAINLNKQIAESCDYVIVFTYNQAGAKSISFEMSEACKADRCIVMIKEK